MKRIGILTMHKVVNYGSALQAWATQEILTELGYSPLIIDYIFPNSLQRRQYKRKYLKDFLQWLLHFSQGFPYNKKKKKFETFWHENFSLTKEYPSIESIQNTPPQFDIFLVGSDQVWNHKNLKGDYTFFLDFDTSSSKCISYASSFAQSQINDLYKEKTKNLLKKFSAISVREYNGYKIIKDLLNKNSHICVDPTLLLQKNDYLKLAQRSTLEFKKPYILVYILQYAYNPYPFATQFIRSVYHKLGFDIICLDFSAKQRLGIRNMIHLHDSVGPEDFIYLFMNASLVITTSFHGTAFALNFNIPFYSIINSESSSDDRMLSLLRNCKAEDRAIFTNDSNYCINPNMNFETINARLSSMRKDSISYLKTNIENT